MLVHFATAPPYPLSMVPMSLVSTFFVIGVIVYLMGRILVVDLRTEQIHPLVWFMAGIGMLLAQTFMIIRSGIPAFSWILDVLVGYILLVATIAFIMVTVSLRRNGNRLPVWIGVSMISFAVLLWDGFLPLYSTALLSVFNTNYFVTGPIISLIACLGIVTVVVGLTLVYYKFTSRVDHVETRLEEN